MSKKTKKRATEKPATAPAAYARLPQVTPGDGLAAVKRGPGRPPVFPEPATKATVLLFDRQIVALDRFALDIRATTGVILNRAELIRDAVEALLQAGIDPATVKSDTDLAALLADRLVGKRGK